MNISRENTYHLSEEQITVNWQHFLEGGSDAFGRIIACYYNGLFQYGMKIHADSAFVEDCLQDMATTLWSKRQQLSRDVHVKGYLFKSLRHKMLRQLQTRKTQQQHLHLWLQGYQPPFNAEFSIESSIIDSDADSQRKQQLHACLQQLSHRQQEIIYLRYFQDLDHEQVAAIMKLSREATYNLLSATLKRLRSQWQLLPSAFSGWILFVLEKKI
ncbi:MAG TPA: sigma-70 family RNA polymerase sigma factor [Chitinophaga sp.]|uniref:RNA polymerase sigma factor n=1 Tax=Chitinophaga sp. TaxID=1869181 RepID=UPI002C29C37A|nr:sigma-70 family RNA polymerase sigma factor [Chitinophaga sp.]HVI45309.1 sigma-70 family RNA polymerase sigma factor [Chitinophaga sp.]